MRWATGLRRGCGLCGIHHPFHHPWLSRPQRRTENLANAKLGVRIDDVSKLTLIFNSVDMKANDPGGLSYQEWQNNPRQSPRGDQYNTRKTIKQTQAGIRYDRQLSEQDDLSVMMYAGEREMTQYQSIPASTQRDNPAHSGGVIDMQRHYQGIDTRWTHRGELLVPVTFTTGLNYENMSENRRGYENFVMNNGVPDFGVKGNKRRDERNLMWNLDPTCKPSGSSRKSCPLRRACVTAPSGLTQRSLHYPAKRR